MDAEASDTIAAASTETLVMTLVGARSRGERQDDESGEDYSAFESLFIASNCPHGAGDGGGEGDKDTSDRDSDDHVEGNDEGEDNAKDPDEGSMRVFVKRIDTLTTTTIYVEEADTVGTLKAILKNTEGIPKYQQRLIKDDITLENGHTLDYYNIHSDSEIQLVPCRCVCFGTRQ